MNVIETIFVVTLYLLYLGLWRIKQVDQKRQTGIDPNVMAKSTSNVQKYMNHLSNILMAYAVLIIAFHSIQLQVGSLFSRIGVINVLLFDAIGFLTGVTGLSFCLYAQLKMGSSWRVGIDEKVKTDLITTGLYKYIRNPTYLGLFLLNIGVWLIWPTWTVFLFNLVFILFLDIQVRCEEDYLSSIHGIKYIEYKKRTKRYIPFLY
ncbi:methyltransferase family protein [Acetivibrio mesophilus]|uniref:Isoprenylcysteine carboxylmethyltransferase family protein n=1 Tax=Acetivibrio mesophilus TaxID=2487273 RepID=A0A4Q0I845_9FIRM|nr:isoprenylcysteine carboxylmethyltransferase family protein [Acetivibrio mesophilus]ODM26337.1 phospholipid methyltransferase [Clostridium sp. Bc-iso-3]RXE60604.1 isoprenylcysteine carboxylmethyltransferase family protein [Acetivibrio mesophilus]HHV30397.1 isoprenylcysteine carboxylmethyltransferase family protein [Clostridium sp.]